MTKDGKLDFTDAARFNYELDTNERLKEGLRELALSYPKITESAYRRRMLELFDEAGISITAKELEMLLLLRQRTDQMLASDKKNSDDDKENEK